MHASTLHRLYRIAVLIVISLFIVKVVRADEQTYQRVLRGTVLVVNKDADGTGLGTGALIDAKQRLVVTAGHVVGDKLDVVVCFPDYGVNGQPITERSHYLNQLDSLGIHARILIRDVSKDVAIIALDRLPAGAQAMPLAARPVTPGQAVCAVGNSGPDDDDFMWCYRDGSVRQACHKQLHTESGNINANMVVTTIASNHGDSGGPVANTRGELVAITISHHPDHTSEDPGQLIGYCTAASEISEVLGQLNLLTSTLSNIPASFKNEPALKNLPTNNITTNVVAARTAKINGVQIDTENSLLSGVYNPEEVDVLVGVGIQGYAHRECKLTCTLADENGNAIGNGQGGFYTAFVLFTPGYDDTLYRDNAKESIHLQFNRGILRGVLQNESRPLSFLISVRDTESGQWVTPAARRVEFTMPAYR